MALTKRTYALPPDTIRKFEQTVDAGKRSNVIARLIADWLAEQERQSLRRGIVEGCDEMAEAYRETERAFNAVDEELHRAVEY